MQRIPISNFKKPAAGYSGIKREEQIKEPGTGPVENNTEEQPKEHKINRSKSAKAWIAIVAVVVVLYTFYLLTNLYSTTVKDYDKYARAAADEQWTLVTYSASRGMIYDANMVPLASNTYDYTLICSPKMVTSTLMDRQQIMDGVVSILGVSYEKLDKILLICGIVAGAIILIVLGVVTIRAISSGTGGCGGSSKNKEVVEMIDVVGSDAQTAKSRLEELGLTVELKYETSDTVEEEPFSERRKRYHKKSKIRYTG